VPPSPGYCPSCGAANDPGAAGCASCGRALASAAPGEGAAQEAPRKRMSRRAALGRALGIAGVALLLPVGGVAAYLAYRKITDPALVTHTSQYADSAAWSPDGTRVVSAGTYGADVWEALTGRRLLTVRPKDSLAGAVWSADGRRVLTQMDALANGAAYSGPLIVTVEVWDAATGQRVRRIRPSATGYTEPVTVALNEPYLAIQRQREDNTVAGQGPQDRVIEIWEIATGRMITAFSGSPAQLLWAPDRRTLATIALDHPSASVHVEIWDAPAGRKLSAFSAPLTMRPPMVARLPVAWLPDQQSLALGLDVYAIDTGLLRARYQVDYHPSGNVAWSALGAVAWSPDSQRLAAAMVTHDIGLYGRITTTIFVLDAADGRQRLAHDARGDLGPDLAFAPDGRYLLVRAGGEVAVWRSA
jgi:WD40 repeat protein